MLQALHFEIFAQWGKYSTSPPTSLAPDLLFVMLRSSTWHHLIQLNTITLDSHIILLLFPFELLTSTLGFVWKGVKSPLLIPGTTRSDWKVKEASHWSSCLMVFSLSTTLASCLVRSSFTEAHYLRSLQRSLRFSELLIVYGKIIETW